MLILEVTLGPDREAVGDGLKIAIPPESASDDDPYYRAVPLRCVIMNLPDAMDQGEGGALYRISGPAQPVASDSDEPYDLRVTPETIEPAAGGENSERAVFRGDGILTTAPCTETHAIKLNVGTDDRAFEVCIYSDPSNVDANWIVGQRLSFHGHFMDIEWLHDEPWFMPNLIGDQVVRCVPAEQMNPITAIAYGVLELDLDGNREGLDDRRDSDATLVDAEHAYTKKTDV